MGLLRCSCSATAAGSGEFTPVGLLQPEPITVDFSISANICPDCTPTGSVVTAVFTIESIEIASFSGTLVGFPECTDEDGDGNIDLLTAEIEGTISIPNSPPQNVTLTATFNALTSEVCIPIDLPIIGTIPCLIVPVVTVSSCI